MKLRLDKEVVETLIKLHEDHIRYVYPNGTTGTFDFTKMPVEFFQKEASDPNRAKFYKIVDSMDLDLRRELIALMWLGTNSEFGVNEFPTLFDHAVGCQDAAAQYLFGKAELSRFLREGMAKLNLS